MKTIILTFFCTTALAGDAMKLPEVEPPKIKLPDGWVPPTDSHVPDKLSFTTFTTYDPTIFVSAFPSNWTVSGGWLVIHTGDSQSWKPDDVLIESKNKPVVTKIGDRWVIRFKP